MLRRRDDNGQLTLLVIGYAAIAVTLIVVGVDASKVFLARRALSSVADAAALRAAQSVDKTALYAGSAGCGDDLPLDPSRAATTAADVITDDLPDLRRVFASVDSPDVTTSNGVATVHLSGTVSVPFGRVLALLLPGHDMRVHVDVTAHARSPLSAPDGC